MKRPVCEICGASDFFKDEGVFTCQSCGTKYSVEEIRKLLAELPDEAVTEPTKAQVREELPPDVFKGALTAYEANDMERAEFVCNHILTVSPCNLDALRLMTKIMLKRMQSGVPCYAEACKSLVSLYLTLNAEARAAEKPELIDTLKKYAECDMLNTFNRLVQARPTADEPARLTAAYNNGIAKLCETLDQLEASSLIEEYTAAYDNSFTDRLYAAAEMLWKEKVAQNYYRDFMNKGKDPFGREDTRWVIADSTLYRPTNDIWQLFVAESDHLINMLQFAETKFNDGSDRDTVIGIYSLISDIAERVMLSGSWKIEQGFEHSWDKYKVQGWKEEYFLSEDTKKSMEALSQSYLYKKRNLADKYTRSTSEEKELGRERYWSQHAEERKTLVSELTELEQKLDGIRLREKRNQTRIQELAETLNGKKLPEEVEAERLEYLVEGLEEDYKKFKLMLPRDKKALRSRIDDVEKPKLFEAKKRAVEERQKITQKYAAEIERLRTMPKEDTSGIQKRISEIHAELNRDR